jgi:hypothetical protein
MNANTTDYCEFPLCGYSFMLTKGKSEYFIGGVLVTDSRTYCNTHNPTKSSNYERTTQ